MNTTDYERLHRGICWLTGWYARAGDVPVAPLRALAGVGDPVTCKTCGGQLEWTEIHDPHYRWVWVCTDEPNPLSRPAHDHEPAAGCAKCGRSDHPMADEHADGTLCDRACGHAQYVPPGGHGEGYCVECTCQNYYALSEAVLAELRER